MKTINEQKEFLTNQLVLYENNLESMIWSQSDLTPLHLNLLKYKSNRLKYKINSIDFLHTEIVELHSGLHMDSKSELRSNSTGLFKVNFDDQKYIYFIYAKEYLNDEDTISLFVGEKELIYRLIYIKNKTFKHIAKPKLGFSKAYKVHSPYGGYELKYEYLKENNLPKIEVFHQTLNAIRDDVRSFFKSNGELYAKYNKPKVRKVLLSGEPGTGKTLISSEVSREFQKTHSIVYVNDFESLIEHFINAFRFSLQTIIIFEDCEYALKELSSYQLNFLDGINQPIHKKGVYIIFTTNYPNLIEDRVSKRPGRIDRIFPIESLKGEFAFNCAKYYFNNVFQFEEKDGIIFNNLTGAQIAEISNSAILTALSAEKPLSLRIIKDTKQLMLQAIQEMNDKAKRESIERQNKMGFSSQMNTPF